uniref:C-type lectin domain-containing protein n=1 Tax=Panagrolaimus sp. ES5 TaxID=591445 RepID=A0AC34FF98_9BILA
MFKLFIVFVYFLLFFVITVAGESSATECGSGYQYFDGTKACYGRSFRYIGHWKDAEENCQKENGHLASIHSNEEAEFISSILPMGTEQLWIGLSNHVGEWQWNDGTLYDYANWKEDPSIGVPKCAIFEHGNFIEKDCEKVGDFHFSICKREPWLS